MNKPTLGRLLRIFHGLRIPVLGIVVGYTSQNDGIPLRAIQRAHSR